MKTELTQEQKRIKIAEACGWKDCHRSEHWMKTIGTLDEVDGDNYKELPDYFNDLNACHEMEKVLTRFQLLNYYNTFLFTIVCGHKESHCALDFAKVCSSTAEQRAEAFGKTLDLW